MQLSPGQQSALIVQPPHAGTQLEVEQTRGATPASAPASAAAGLGTHGTWLQQSALEAQACPAPRHCTLVQRGTPTMSGLQVSFVSQLPAQQSHDALQLMVESLHTLPFGLHPIGLRQLPRTLGGVMLHAPGAVKQQSLSCLHTSPTTWQPLAGWHTSTPVGP
jgi:hypothetical protein